MLYVRDPDPKHSQWSINGLALLARKTRSLPCSNRFHNDSSSTSGARRLQPADSRVLSHDLRQKAVPELISLRQDPDLDQTTRQVGLPALREIPPSRSSPTMRRLGDLERYSVEALVRQSSDEPR